MASKAIFAEGVEESEIDQYVAAISQAADGKTIIPETQAEALIRREAVGQSRDETAEALDLSVWAVDDRLGRAKGNIEAVAETADVLDGLGAWGLENVAVGETATPDVEAPEPEREPTEADPSPWAELMALDSVTEVSRPASSCMITVELTEASDGEFNEAVDLLERLGAETTATANSGGDVVSLRAWTDETEAPERLRDGEESDESEEPDESDDESEEYACPGCGETFESPGALGGHSRYCSADTEGEA